MILRTNIQIFVKSISSLPSTTPNFNCCKKYCVNMSRMASASSAANMIAMPMTLKSALKLHVPAVPSDITTTEYIIGSVGVSILAMYPSYICI